MQKSEQQITEEWANSMLDEATDEMDEKGISITPESLSKYFEKNYELPFTPDEAKRWLSEQKWYK